MLKTKGARGKQVGHRCDAAPRHQVGDEMRVLVVDDDAQAARRVSSALDRGGHKTAVLHDGKAALAACHGAAFDLLVLEIDLPKVDGFRVLRQLRAQHNNMRVVMLTARAALNDRLMALRLGADDYLIKPFALQELLARVNALARRYAEARALTLRVDDLSIDLADQIVRRGADGIQLSAREFTLLKVLMQAPGRVFTRRELCARVWGRPPGQGDKVVEVFIGRLRRKIGLPRLIETIRHTGYAINSAGAVST